MTSLTIPFYDVLKPSNNEIVLVKFTEHKKEYIDGYLLEYNCKLFLNYSDATKKRNVSSWQKIVPLNESMIAKVEDANYTDDIVQVSLTYMYDSEENKKMNETFLKNHFLVSYFKKIAHINNYDINILWKNIMYKIDILRRETYEGDEMPTLYEFCNNKEMTEEILLLFKDTEYEKTVINFLEELENNNKEKPKKIISEIEIISNGGVQNTKLLIEKALETIKFENTFKYKSTPTFLFESNNSNSTDIDHKKFIEYLIQEGQKMTPKTFVRSQKTYFIDF
jgi:translation initiation factor 2 alpha subunit (eIF-2alpha)